MSYNFFSNNTNLFQQYSKSFLVRGKTSILEFKSVDMVDDDGNVKDIKRLVGRPKYRDIT